MTNTEFMAALEARIAHLQELRQPGPVDLGPEDNEQAQDDLFHELAVLEDAHERLTA